MAKTFINPNNTQETFGIYQKFLLRGYIGGYVLMVIFNWACYPGSYIGVFGWAIIWPIYIPTNLLWLWLFGTGIPICPGPIAGTR